MDRDVSTSHGVSYRLVALVPTVLELHGTDVTFLWTPGMNLSDAGAFSMSSYSPKAVG